MEARCYRGGEGRTRLKVMQMKRSDILFSIFFGLAAAAILLLQFVQLT
jgi:energy-coupling factor transport system permease protein